MSPDDAIAHVDAGHLELEPEALAAKLGLTVMEAFDLQQAIIGVLAPIMFDQQAETNLERRS